MKENGNMKEHITTMSGYFEKLATLSIGAMLLESLPESYETLVTALESRLESDIVRTCKK